MGDAMQKIHLQSIGMSCQTRHQIERFAASETARSAGLELRTGPFDWLGAPPLRVAAYLDAGLPEHEFEGVVDRNGRAFLAGPEFHAVHGYRVREADGTRRLDIAATFERERAKLAHLRQKFLSIDPARTCFVLANCQNNIVGDLYDAGETEEYRFDSAKIDVLHASLERLFAARCELLVISREDRFDGDAGRDRRVHLLMPDGTEWKGDDAQWSEVLGGHFGLGRTQEPVAAARA